jgi:purine-binding chemotaxis protein CheW
MGQEEEKEDVKNRREAAVEPVVHLIVFKLGEEEYGIRIEQVKEVTITPEITRMPKTPSIIKGVANIRGDIIAIMDLEERFQIRTAKPDPGSSRHTYTLALEARDYTIGLIVRDVPQSLTLPVSKLDKTPAFIQDININENFIEGIGKIEGRLIIVLDILRILSAEEVQQLKD